MRGNNGHAVSFKRRLWRRTAIITLSIAAAGAITNVALAATNCGGGSSGGSGGVTTGGNGGNSGSNGDQGGSAELTTKAASASITLGHTNDDVATVTATDTDSDTGSNTGSKSYSGSSNESVPQGSVTFWVCGPLGSAPSTNPTSSQCSTSRSGASSTKVGTVSAPTSTSGHSAVFTSPAFTPSSPGWYCFYASFSGSKGWSWNSSASSSSALGHTQSGAPSECFQVTAATPTVTTSVATPASTLLGSHWGDSATVTGVSAGGAPTGKVSWTLCEESHTGTPCTTGTSLGSTSTASRSGNASIFALPAADDATPQSAGTWCFNTSFSATSSDYTSASGSPECFAVTSASTTPATADLTTTVDDSNGAWTGAEQSGAIAHDTASLAGVAGHLPTGTVTYRLFDNGTCAGDDATSQVVDVNSGTGAVPDSAATSALDSGSYSYLASYSGNSYYAPATASCEPFSVGLAQVTVATAVDDAKTDAAWAGSETSGAEAYDTASLSYSAGAPTGTVTYTLYANDDCSGDGTAAGVETISDGTVPNSATSSPLAPGSYSYLAAYSGDGTYGAGNGSCETLSVAKVTTGTDTAVVDAGTDAAWSGTETTAASAIDTATVSGSATYPPSGTLTYSLYDNGDCSASPASTDQVTLNEDGSVPDSSSTGPLIAGSYSYQAVYSGDTYNTTSTGACEPFAVALTPAAVSGAAIMDPTSGSYVSPGSTVTYTVTIKNIGETFLDPVVVTDQVPTGTTFLSAGQGGSLLNGLITWPGINLVGLGSSTVTFTVKVNSADPNNDVIPNTAYFTNVNTPGCGSALTCATNTVTMTVRAGSTGSTGTSTTTTPTSTTTSTSTSTSTTSTTTGSSTTSSGSSSTTAKTSGGLAFTGANIAGTAGGGLLLGLLGLLLVGAERRRRQA